jgi:hypothetical protein
MHALVCLLMHRRGRSSGRAGGACTHSARPHTRSTLLPPQLPDRCLTLAVVDTLQPPFEACAAALCGAAVRACASSSAAAVLACCGRACGVRVLMCAPRTGPCV